VLTRRDLFDPETAESARLREVLKRPPVVVFSDSSLREAADHMVREAVGRLPVVDRAAPARVVAILTRSDLLAAHGPRLRAERPGAPHYRLSFGWLARRRAGSPAP
jgi:predicted transcriptional regulator